ncbi:MAG TPA: hypothetical protein VNS22_01415 [Geminicoccus sp.]|uniref:hypothetical protein n=1 Tax=Geminicoccus sp. TaxID=2024832 RepID=UPI002BDB70E9|nr:hypothetical protein [Geminicoccus sp.]HWL67022.1 hypothetical protein [Geminicoccus sp.]
MQIPLPTAIDYCGTIDGSAGMPVVGETMVSGFRPQVFVTRAYSVGVAGLASGMPAVEAIHDALGRPADWP